MGVGSLHLVVLFATFGLALGLCVYGILFDVSVGFGLICLN